jgi:aspartate-semialdehyde dehydrogenase
MLLNPFIRAGKKIKRIVVSTYQAASGAGKDGLEELKTQTKEWVDGKDLTIDYWKQPYVFNTFVHNSEIENNGYCQEENKIINETRKIFNTYLWINPTCIRVPIIRSHCESVNIEFEEPIYEYEIMDLIKSETTLEIIDNKQTHNFPSSISSNNKNVVQVGHIRMDYSLDSCFGWNFWISGDQLIRGAAYNAFLIVRMICDIKDS